MVYVGTLPHIQEDLLFFFLFEVRHHLVSIRVIQNNILKVSPLLDVRKVATVLPANFLHGTCVVLCVHGIMNARSACDCSYWWRSCVIQGSTEVMKWKSNMNTDTVLPQNKVQCTCQCTYMEAHLSTTRLIIYKGQCVLPNYCHHVGYPYVIEEWNWECFSLCHTGPWWYILMPCRSTNMLSSL